MFTIKGFTTKRSVVDQLATVEGLKPKVVIKEDGKPLKVTNKPPIEIYDKNESKIDIEETGGE